MAVVIACLLTGIAGELVSNYLNAFGTMAQQVTSDGNPLSGALPPNINNLIPNVVVLKLSLTVTGTIPPSIGSLVNLQELNLDNNAFVGPIPPLSQLTNLRYLSLARNNLTGTIPDLGALTQLIVLDLSRNRLAGSLPTIGPKIPTSLNFLLLGQNRLVGTLPASVGSLQNLVMLELYYNNFTGPIPKELGNCAQLQTLWLARNALTGTIPSELGYLSNLQELLLHSNRLRGSIPTSFGLLSSLQSLSLSNNTLTGTIPASVVANWSSLSTWEMEGNSFQGSIPFTLDQLPLIRELVLASNKLVGTFPPQPQSLSPTESPVPSPVPSPTGAPTPAPPFSTINENIVLLDVSNNLLEGPVDVFQGVTYPALEYLFLNGNRFAGTMFDYECNPGELTVIKLDNNAITGTVPDFKFVNWDITELTFGNNKLVGSLAEKIRCPDGSVTVNANGNNFDCADCPGNNLTVDFSVPVPSLVLPSQTLVLTATFPSNYWLSSGGTVLTQTRWTYPPGFFPPNTDQLLWFNLTVQSPTLKCTTETSVTVRTTETPLVVVVVNPNRQAVVGSSVTFDASNSFDPDKPNTPLTNFAWSGISLGGATLDASGPRAVLTSRQAGLSSFRVSVTSGLKTAVLNCSVQFVAAKVLNISLIPGPKNTMNPNDVFRAVVGINEVLTNPTFQWSVSPPVTACLSLGQTSRSFAISPGCIKPTLPYQITLFVKSSEGTANVSQTFVFTVPPSGGACNVYPAQGTAVLTRFNVSCGGWQSNTGLSYIYRYNDTANRTQTLGASLEPQDVILPRDISKILVEVVSGQGAITRVPVDVKVTPPRNISCTALTSPQLSAQLQPALYLQHFRAAVQEADPVCQGKILDVILPLLPEVVRGADIYQIEIIANTLATVERTVSKQNLPKFQEAVNTCVQVFSSHPTPVLAQQLSISLDYLVQTVTNCSDIPTITKNVATLASAQLANAIPGEKASCSGCTNGLNVTGGVLFTDAPAQLALADGILSVTFAGQPNLTKSSPALSQVTVSNYRLNESCLPPVPPATTPGLEPELVGPIIDIRIDSATPAGTPGEAARNKTVSFPLRMVGVDPCEVHTASCVWWDHPRQAWSTQGCSTTTTTVNGLPTAICTCNHLTEFTLLARLDKTGVFCPSKILRGGFALTIGGYGVGFVWASVQLGIFLKLGNNVLTKGGPLHILLILLTITRAITAAIVGAMLTARLSRLAQAVLLLVPYAFFYAAFVRLPFQWSDALLSMGRPAIGQRLLQAYFASNIVVAGTTLALAIAIGIVTPGPTAVRIGVVGTMLVSFFTLVIGVYLLVSGCILARDMGKARGQSSKSSTDNNSVRTKYLTCGTIMSLCLIGESIIHIVSSLKKLNETGYFILLLIELPAIYAMLFLYNKGMTKDSGRGTLSSPSRNRDNSHRSSHSGANEMVPVAKTKLSTHQQHQDVSKNKHSNSSGAHPPTRPKNKTALEIHGGGHPTAMDVHGKENDEHEHDVQQQGDDGNAHGDGRDERVGRVTNSGAAGIRSSSPRRQVLPINTQE